MKLLFKYHLVMSAGYACILKVLFQKYKIHSVQHYFFKHAHVLKWHISWAITKINISMEEIVREFRDKRNLKLLWVKKWKNGEIKYVLIAWLPQGKNHNFLNISSNTSTSSRPVNNFSISNKLLQSLKSRSVISQNQCYQNNQRTWLLIELNYVPSKKKLLNNLDFKPASEHHKVWQRLPLKKSILINFKIFTFWGILFHDFENFHQWVIYCVCKLTLHQDFTGDVSVFACLLFDPSYALFFNFK